MNEVHIYFMAPLKPSPTQLRVTTLCKEKAPVEEVASTERKASCSRCIMRARRYLAEVDDLKPSDGGALANMRHHYLLLLPEVKA